MLVIFLLACGVVFSAVAAAMAWSLYWDDYPWPWWHRFVSALFCSANTAVVVMNLVVIIERV